MSAAHLIPWDPPDDATPDDVAERDRETCDGCGAWSAELMAVEDAELCPDCFEDLPAAEPDDDEDWL